uniref:RluA family pseudouridine synthase n=1 Tax=uncultured marine group II/III euryarchaeote AD1000_01_H07 TaxID=1457699 RepID=A0A075FGX0_9EURY|nr:RluA family pseudouridine synthase [uncultured marine group II/III euryarchaeote AD1000_01_H07]
MVRMVVNIAGYRFVNLPDRDELREPMLDVCLEAGLKGTVLLSPNGINFFLAGTEEATNSFISHLESDERLASIPVKLSHTDYQPFRRMLVKPKKEIISLGMDDIRPAEFTAPHISPNEFKQMLDGGEDIVVLDARNDYETRVGMFDGAVDLDIASFRDFPGAIESLPEEYQSKTVVMYCTGGIRCEKASAVMLKAGFEDVRQLEGGILGYFEECGGTHWSGDCFVFDQRVALDHQLEETEVVMCFRCREPLSSEEQLSELYVINQHCPYCVTDESL